ncbi:patatin-like phospholipase family protein [Peijinzhouia sedimentorum]
MTVLNKIFYSFPIQLFFLHLKKNHGLLLIWVLLFITVTGNFGRVFGIPYLFLDPEYLGQTGFLSFFVVGIVLGGFIMAFNISSYILDGPRYSFLGTLKRPFSKFFVNNLIIPLSFIIVYINKIVQFQRMSEQIEPGSITIKIIGLLAGVIIMLTFLFTYFRFTNKDIFRLIARSLDVKLKKAKITRVNVVDKLNKESGRKTRVDNYLTEFGQIKTTPYRISNFDRAAIIKVFDQNHLNSVIIELVIFVVIILIGLFRDNSFFQIPAAASAILLFTLLVMLGGAISYWFREWASVALIVILIGVNILVKIGWLNQPYQAYGLNYDKAPQTFQRYTLDSLHSEANAREDKVKMLNILENWRAKQVGEEKPKLVVIGSSGGGLRSALWNLHVLQNADSLTEGKLFDRTVLMAGASGGMVGAAYFRELKYRELLSEEVNPYSPVYTQKIAKDLLNPIIFTLIVNDFFFIKQKFKYNGRAYSKERGYAFEQQLNANTDGILDRPLGAYREAEQSAKIPMVLIAPSVVNNGRKLYISPQSFSFLATYQPNKLNGGIDFQRLFSHHSADSLRFLTALRMNATFPYISPNVYLPTEPAMEIMDAGLADNFGLSDAMDFLDAFQDWIEENTSGVIVVSIRDSERIPEVKEQFRRTLIQKLFVPLSALTNNWAKQQDIKNEQKLIYLQSSFSVPIERIEFQYLGVPALINNSLATGSTNERLFQEEVERASLSWHLTSREKQSILNYIYHPRNQAALRRLQQIL